VQTAGHRAIPPFQATMTLEQFFSKYAPREDSQTFPTSA
jgi:hypothetical protein